jgi:hypothetical protein
MTASRAIAASRRSPSLDESAATSDRTSEADEDLITKKKLGTQNSEPTK